MKAVLSVLVIITVVVLGRIFIYQGGIKRSPVLVEVSKGESIPDIYDQKPPKDNSLSNDLSIKSLSQSPKTVLSDDGPQEISAALEERYHAISENDRYPTLLSRISAMKARRPDAQHSPEDVLAAVERPVAWETKSTPGPKLKRLTEEELSDGRQFVDFDPLKVETLMVGDHMDIAVDSIGRVFDMKVDSVRIYDDGNIKWKGPITNVDGGGIVTITQSPKITVAAVVLKQKDFTLEAYGLDGWIINSGALFKVDPNTTDVVYPEEHLN